jgi:hypothetical protein
MLRVMKRLILSVICGVSFPLLCLAVGFPLDEGGHGRLATVFLSLAAWPVALVSPLVPGSDSPNPNVGLIRAALYSAAMLLSVAAYSLLAYLLLRRRAKAKRLA